MDYICLRSAYMDFIDVVVTVYARLNPLIDTLYGFAAAGGGGG